MATLTIRGLKEDALAPPPTGCGYLGSRIRGRFAGLGELDLPARDSPAFDPQ